MSWGILVAVPGLRLVRGKATEVQTCMRCGAEDVAGHEFEGRLYCPNCGVEMKRGMYNLPRHHEAVEAFGGVVFPDPARVKGSPKPAWRMDELVI